MKAHTATADPPPDRSECWCCGTIADPAHLVCLGNHPEVTVCVRCAHAISRWAWEIEDEARTGLAVRIRDRLRRLRATLVGHGWHQSRFIGRALRWLGRYAP